MLSCFPVFFLAFGEDWGRRQKSSGESFRGGIKRKQDSNSSLVSRKKAAGGGRQDCQESNRKVSIALK